MIRRTRHLPRWVMILVMLMVLPAALPCGPYFNDAHHGLDQDPVTGSFAAFYVRMLRPDSDLYRLVAASRAAVDHAGAAEKAGHWQEALTVWSEAAQTMGFDAQAAHAFKVREVHDHQDLLPLIGQGLTPQEWGSYLASVEDRSTEPAGQARNPQALLRLAASRNEHLASAALTTLGWRELTSGHLDQGLADLATALARDPHGAKSDEDAYLTAVAPVFAHLSHSLKIDAPGPALVRIQAWIDTHPASRWRPHALGWQAAILYHNPECGWKGDAHGVTAATRIWQDLLGDGNASELSITSIDSLSLAYRRLQRAPPAWMLFDPRHAAAFAWQVVSGNQYDQDHSADLELIEPAMQRLADGNIDAAAALALAQVWYHAGRPATALPLARKALALRDMPDARYLLARLCAETGDAQQAEQVVQPLAASANPFDVLVRIGSQWENQKEWGKALAAYVRANAWMDVILLSEGEMPLVELENQVGSGGPFIAAIGDSWEERPAGQDYMPELRQRLAMRLVRADRPKEARAFFDDERRGLCSALIALQDDLAAATPAQRPDRLYALATFWYGEGRKLVFIDRHWHQWAYGRYFQGSENQTPADDLARADYAKQMDAMNVYQRAYPMFLEIADRYPQDPHAADALYHAALCRYWLCDQTYMKHSFWWHSRAEAEHYQAQGTALLRRLAVTYPHHPLARDPKVVRAQSAALPR